MQVVYAVSAIDMRGEKQVLGFWVIPTEVRLVTRRLRRIGSISMALVQAEKYAIAHLRYFNEGSSRAEFDNRSTDGILAGR